MMKKITTLFVLTTLTFFTGNAQFPETFNGSTQEAPEGWVIFDNGLALDQIWQVNIGFHYILVFGSPSETAENGEDWLVTPQFMVDAANPILSFDQFDLEEQDKGSVYTIRVSTQSQTTASDFTIVDTQTEATMTHLEWSNHTVDLSAYAGQTIYVAFVLTQNNGDMWGLDNVNMTPANTNATQAFEKEPIKFYPNPVSNLLTIKSEQTINRIAVTDISGKIVSVIENAAITNNSIQMTDLEKGLYIITVYTENSTENFKVFKQ